MINRELARQAYAGISFTPDKRGEQLVADFEGTVGSLRETLLKLAGADERLQAVAEDEVARFREGYAARYNKWMAAMGRTMSTMITGPANFPVRRNEKRLRVADSRQQELTEFRERAFAAARKHVLAARSPEQVQDEELIALCRRIDRDMQTVAEIDAGTAPYDRSAFTTSVTGRLQRLARDGKVETVRAALEYIRERQTGWKKPFLAARNSAWKLAEVATAKAEAPKPSGEVLLGVYAGPAGGARVINNHDEERVQIYFDDKPAEPVRRALGAEGWNFSRRNGNAWQRKNTTAAEWSARRILEAQGFALTAAQVTGDE